MHNDMWEITKFNIIYFVFVILVLKQSVITLSNIPTIYIIAITQKCMSFLIIHVYNFNFVLYVACTLGAG